MFSRYSLFFDGVCLDTQPESLLQRRNRKGLGRALMILKGGASDIPQVKK